MWKIYKHTFPNEKVYIGLTCQTNKNRFRNGNGYQECPIMWRAICKYGWENVKTEIIEENIPTLSEAKLRERFWIKEYNSFINFPNSCGYNATLGGEGYTIYDREAIYKDWKDGLSNKQIREKYGINKDSITNILKSFGVTIKEMRAHTAKTISETQNIYREPAYQLWLQGFSRKEISEKLGCSIDSVIRALNYYDVPIEERRARGQKVAKKSTRRVGQYSEDGILIAEYDSIIKALVAVGAPRNSGNISQVCKGNRKIAYGYIWKYLDD